MLKLSAAVQLSQSLSSHTACQHLFLTYIWHIITKDCAMTISLVITHMCMKWTSKSGTGWQNRMFLITQYRRQRKGQIVSWDWAGRAVTDNDEIDSSQRSSSLISLWRTTCWGKWTALQNHPELVPRTTITGYDHWIYSDLLRLKFHD